VLAGGGKVFRADRLQIVGHCKPEQRLEKIRRNIRPALGKQRCGGDKPVDDALRFGAGNVLDGHVPVSEQRRDSPAILRARRAHPPPQHL
jgi:hypothetical protein